MLEKEKNCSSEHETLFEVQTKELEVEGWKIDTTHMALH